MKVLDKTIDSIENEPESKEPSKDELATNAYDIIAKSIKDNDFKFLSDFDKSGQPIENSGIWQSDAFAQLDLLKFLNIPQKDIEKELKNRGLERLQIEGLFQKVQENKEQHTANIPKGHTTREYEHREVPKVNWLVEDLIPSGLIILGAPIKSRKSFMMLDLCMQVSTGMDWFGKPTKKSTALYFDLEVSADSTQRRIERLCMGKKVQFDNLVFYNLEEDESQKIKRIGEGFEQQFESILLAYPNTRLAVVDMYQCIRPIRTQAENYQQDYADLGKLKAITRKYPNLTIILVHHTRKSKDENDVLNNLNGSSGLGGAVDGLIMIDKQRRQDAEATIHFEGKDIISQDILASFDIVSMKWQAEGTVEDVEWMNFLEHPITKAIQNLCNESGNWQGTTAELIESAWDEFKIGISLAESETAKQNARLVGRYIKDNLPNYRKLGYNITTRTIHEGRTKYFISCQ